MRRTILALALMLVPLTAAPAEPARGGDVPEVGVPGADIVAAHIRWFLTEHCGSPICERWAAQDKRWKTAGKLGALVAQAAAEHGLDPLYVAVTVQFESSFWVGVRPGKHEEIGLMQVHGAAETRARAAGYDMTTSIGQLRAGCLELARCLAVCGSELGGMSCYKQGDCNPGENKAPAARMAVLTGARSRLLAAETLAAQSAGGDAGITPTAIAP